MIEAFSACRITAPLAIPGALRYDPRMVILGSLLLVLALAFRPDHPLSCFAGLGATICFLAAL